MLRHSLGVVIDCECFYTRINTITIIEDSSGDSMVTSKILLYSRKSVHGFEGCEAFTSKAPSMSSDDVTPSKPACTKMDLYKLFGLSVLYFRNN